MRHAILAALLALVACTTQSGSFCDISKPVRLTAASIDALSDAEVRDIARARSFAIGCPDEAGRRAVSPAAPTLTNDDLSGIACGWIHVTPRRFPNGKCSMKGQGP
jgi:hypothetical protein